MSIGEAIVGAIGVAVVGVCLVAGATALGWFGAENGFRLTQHYAPKYEQVRRTTFEQSQAYVEGQRRDIANLRLDWLDATGDRKAAIRSVALERIAGLPESALSSDITAFRNELMGVAQ